MDFSNTSIEQNIFALSNLELHKQELRTQLVLHFLDFQQKDVILDVGCAEGFITRRFKKSDFVVGLDTCKSNFSLAKQKTAHYYINFILADCKHLPFRAESFNKLVILEVLENLHKK